MVSRAVAAAAVLWFGALVAAPWLSTAVAAVLYAAGSLVCHQLPERSVHLGGLQLPVCARCLGIYAGLAFGALGWLRADLDRCGAVRWPVADWFAVAAAPTLVTVALEAGGVLHTTNVVRLLAGAALGIGASAVVMWAGATLHYERCQQQVGRRAGAR